MIRRLLEPLLSGAPVFRNRPWLLVLFLAAAPFAFLAARQWQRQTAPQPLFHLEGHHEALARARATARALGLNVQGWTVDFRIAVDQDLNRYLEDRRGQLPPEVSQTVPAVITCVLLHAPDFKSWVEFRYTQSGKLLRLEWAGIARPPRPATDDEALAIARAAVESAFPPEHFELGEPAVKIGDATGDEQVRSYEWKARARCCPELVANSSARAYGRHLTFFFAASFVDDAFKQRYRTGRETPLDALRWLFIFAGSLFAGYRFAARAAEGEVPYRRIAVVFAVFAVFSAAIVLLAPFVTFARESVWSIVGGARPIFYAMTLVYTLVAGVLVALSYGAAEGDLREWFPGKLVSLDAVLSGRVWSSNAGAAIVIGAAWGAFGFAGVQLWQMAAEGAWVPLPVEPIQWSFNRAPWLLVMLDILTRALVALTMGLLIPTVAAFRVAHSWRLRYLVLAGMALWAFAAIAAATDAGMLSMAIAGVAVAWLCFVTSDFLAAIVSQMVIHIGGTLATTELVMPSWNEPAAIVRGIALATLGAACMAVFRGRRYSDHEVRPTYAGNIARRLVLEAEVAAAGEAQRRLLPERAPEIPGLEVAAFCTPARSVSGDFYDFFPMSRGRLALLVADGRTGGLGAALSIALAKGFLHYAAQRDWPPGETLAGLGKLLDNEPMSLAYLVVEPALKQIRFARTGASPYLLTMASQDNHNAQPLEAADGVLTLHPGDVLLIHTNAVAPRLEASYPQGLNDWVASHLRSGEAASLSAGSIAEALAAALNTTAITAATAPAPDDLTAVVIRIVPRADSLESVA